MGSQPDNIKNYKQVEIPGEEKYKKIIMFVYSQGKVEHTHALENIILSRISGESSDSAGENRRKSEKNNDKVFFFLTFFQRLFMTKKDYFYFAFSERSRESCLMNGKS